MKQRKKIGILTHYYNSLNYGGNLQAYALVKFLNMNNYIAEQVCYNRNKNIEKIKKQLFIKYCYTLRDFIFHHKILRNIKIREKKIKYFNKHLIPHSNDIYTDNDIENITEKYDILVTGSDQVWHPNAVTDAYLLNFSKKEISKISYAASVATDDIDSEKQKKYRQALSDYAAISVRELDTVEMIKKISGRRDVELTLDPIFLISKNDWNDIIPENLINKKYIFCYFLSNSLEIRKIARDYAEKFGYTVVTIPFLEGVYRKSEEVYGNNSQYYYASPVEFISLIANSEVVFTDSFHAVAFSILFSKQFFCFGRKNYSGMATRIQSILNIFKIENRFIKDYHLISISELENISRIKYKENKVFNDLLERSKYFLLDNIK